MPSALLLFFLGVILADAAILHSRCVLTDIVLYSYVVLPVLGVVDPRGYVVLPDAP
jgi:hypothetical protein